MPLPLSGLLGRFTAQAGGQAVGFGVGVALSEVLRPEATQLGQEAWKLDPVRAPDAGTMAEGVAQGQVDPVRAAEWAAEHGYGAEAFDALVSVANVGPALGLAYQAWRRGHLSDGEFTTALRRTGLETRWNDAMRALRDNLLEPGEIAKAIHRGIMAAEGLLVAVPPTTPGNVPMVPPSPLDPTEEAAGAGLSAERLRVLVGNAGLPPGIVQMLQLLNRGRITSDDFLRGVAESNLRNEWGEPMLELARHLLTPHEYAEAELRGLRTPAERAHGAGLAGMEPGDSELLYELLGRPLAVRQVTTGLARGGHYGGVYEGVPEPYLDAIRRSAIRPEYGNLAYANRYTYPSAFVLRAMTAAGDITPARAEQVLLYQGWEPTFARQTAQTWAGSTDGAGKAETKAELADEYEGGFITEAEYRAALAALGYAGHVQDLLVHLGDARRVKRYREKAIDAVAAAYVSFKVTDTRATAELAELNVRGQAATLLLSVWAKQRLDSVRLLTAPQIKRAYKKGLLSEADALDALEWQHYTADDAALFLAE